jgi:hypothetical protein
LFGNPSFLILRDWLLANPLFDKKTGMMLPDEVIEKTVEKYEAIRKLLVEDE